MVNLFILKFLLILVKNVYEGNYTELNNLHEFEENSSSDKVL